MAVTSKVLVAPKQLENAQTTQYTATSVRAIIDKATITNTSAANVTVSVNLVTSGGSAGASNLIISSRTIVPGEAYLCPELVGQILDSGSFISTIAGAATSLTMRVSGREVS
jgi:P pilus assembly chaperone PapD